MILTTQWNGSNYKYLEKGNRACIIRDEIELLWWGDPNDAVSVDDVPLKVLLAFSTMRNEQ